MKINIETEDSGNPNSTLTMACPNEIVKVNKEYLDKEKIDNRYIGIFKPISVKVGECEHVKCPYLICMSNIEVLCSFPKKVQ